jgi:hypothetical protein
MILAPVVGCACIAVVARAPVRPPPTLIDVMVVVVTIGVVTVVIVVVVVGVGPMFEDHGVGERHRDDRGDGDRASRTGCKRRNRPSIIARPTAEGGATRG